MLVVDQRKQHSCNLRIWSTQCHEYEVTVAQADAFNTVLPHYSASVAKGKSLRRTSLRKTLEHRPTFTAIKRIIQRSIYNSSLSVWQALWDHQWQHSTHVFWPWLLANVPWRHSRCHQMGGVQILYMLDHEDHIDHIDGWFSCRFCTLASPNLFSNHRGADFKRTFISNHSAHQTPLAQIHHHITIGIYT